ncbi:MAG: dihydrolipoyl dehydrogenase [Arenicellales bacterium]
MSKKLTIVVPELGDFDQVPVIEILVSVGDNIKIEAPLLTLESDKATMDIPSSHAGTVTKVLAKIGQEMNPGDEIIEISLASSDEVQATEATEPTAETPAQSSESARPAPVASTSTAATTDNSQYDADVVVIGAGPGGYTAAFRAADLGQKVILIERYPDLGGVCLNVGCIPSKALLHAAKVIEEAQDADAFGLSFAAPKIDTDKLLSWKATLVKNLTGGLAQLAKQRKVAVMQGVANFTDDHSLAIEHDGKVQTISFKHAIIAAGSSAVQIPSFPNDDPRLIDSTGALAMDDVPKTMLVIGGGIIGLEMATVYHALGTKISVVEMMDALIPGADPDLVRPLQRKINKQYENIWLDTRVTGIEALKKGLKVNFEGKKAPESQVFDKVLVAVGRSPNGAKISAEKAGINVTERGFIEVDDQQRTNVAHIFAIGDVVGQPMLAHKAVHEAKVAAEVAAGHKSGFDARVIPSVAYTDPEIAWVGVTETEAKAQKLNYGIGKFPWAASGRSLSLNRKEGITKAIFDEDTKRLIGCGIVGPSAGDLIAEAALAIEMNADATDIGLTIHPHPTLSETIGFAAEAFEGTITDLYMPKKAK